MNPVKNSQISKLGMSNKSKPTVCVVFTHFLHIYIERKCNEYIRDNLRVPSREIVYRWGKQLKINRPEVKSISDRLWLRHRLGKIKHNLTE